MGEYQDYDCLEPLPEEEGIWIPVSIIRETEKALMVLFCNKEIWIPKSQIFSRKKGQLKISTWLYDKKVNELLEEK